MGEREQGETEVEAEAERYGGMERDRNRNEFSNKGVRKAKLSRQAMSFCEWTLLCSYKSVNCS